MPKVPPQGAQRPRLPWTIRLEYKRNTQTAAGKNTIVGFRREVVAGKRKGCEKPVRATTREKAIRADIDFIASNQSVQPFSDC